ncbi:hypothetical protein KA005_37255, partial [bacterium]|nr:hypothetical protein [bacterium]
MNKPEAAGRLREIKVQTYRTLGTAINRFHIVSLTFLFVLLILVLNKDFTPSKWSVADSRLRSWLSAFDQHLLTRALEYRLVVDSKITESDRKTLTQSILASGIADFIPPSLQMSKMSKFLGDQIYGVDFVELPKLEAALKLMEKQEGASILQDLSRF